MGDTLTGAGRTDVETIGRQHGVPTDAVTTLFDAIRRGSGRQAQFSHPALGGMGQWSRGGGVMIGDMFNHSLRDKVERLCNELAEHAGEDQLSAADPRGYGQHWWPDDLGAPSATGSQNDEDYACFPQARRLAIRGAEGVRLYDTADHRISGIAQRQGIGRDLSFTSQHGMVRLSDLRRSDDDHSQRRRTAPEGIESPDDHQQSDERAAPSARVEVDVVGLIERLHELQRAGVLTAEEFVAKKTELLARL